jgi:hypothetical protein
MRANNSLAAAIVFFSAVCIATAAQVDWQGASGDWSEQTNWSGFQVPTYEDDVVVDTSYKFINVTHSAGNHGAASLVNREGLVISGGLLSVLGQTVNHGSIDIQGGDLLLYGGWTNNGSMTLTSGRLTLGGNYTTADLYSGFTRVGGDLRLQGRLDNTGSTLAGLGAIRVDGMVVGGSIGSTADPCEVSGSGGFENATINGHLSGAPILRGNMVLNGSADVGTIYFYGAGGSTMASLSASAGKTALITLSGSSPDLRIEEGAWLTLASNVTVEGSGDIGGSIGADVNRLINYGTIRATGAMNVLTHYFDNRGTLSIEEGGTVELGLSDQQGMREQTYTSANGGAIHVNGGTLNLYDDFTTADLNQDQFVRNGGQVNINGTLNNEGMTLDRIGPFRLNGKIFGGVIGSALRPAEVDFHGALESVTVYGELDGSGSIRDRLTLNGVAGGGDLSFSAAGDCATITLNSSEGYTGTVNMNGSDLWVDSTDTLVVGEGITIQGWGGLGAHYGGDTLAGIVNYGVIRANGNATGDYETLEMLTNDLDNRGLIVVEDGAVLQFGLREQAGYYEQKWTNANGGAIHVKGGVLDLYGDFDTADLNQATFDRTGGEVRIHGTLNNGGMTLDNIGGSRLTAQSSAALSAARPARPMWTSTARWRT